MYAMNSKDKLLLEDYKALGTPEQIRERLSSPYPAADEGYAPVPWAENFEGDGRPDSGLLTDDEIEIGCPFDEGVGTIEDGMVSRPYDGSTIIVDDWEDK